MAVKQKVQSAIADNKVMVFSKSYCPFCSKAKAALSKHTKDYTVWEIEREPECQEIQDVLAELTGGRSVPRVFINGKFLGGGNETAAADANGTLPKLLAA